MKISNLCHYNKEFDWKYDLDNCLDYVFEILFTKLEVEMKLVGDELKQFGEKCASSIY